MELTIVDLPERLVAKVRHVGPYPEAKHAWMALMGWAFPAGVITPETEYLGLCYDNPDTTPPEQIRYDATITVPAGTQGADPVTVEPLPGGKYAMTLHKGPYENLKETYEAIMPAMQAQSLTFRMSHGMEKYLNDPMQTPPEELLTEIYMPIE